MFERFTSSARGTVVRAQEEARLRGDGWIGTEHVVLALAEDDGIAGVILRAAGVSRDQLLRELDESSPREADPETKSDTGSDAGSDSGIDADALRSIGIDLDDVRRSVEERFGAGALDGPGEKQQPRRRGRRQQMGHIPFTKRAKHSLERGLRQAIMLGHTRIGSEHLLLGVLDDGGGLGVRLLRQAGVDIVRLRAATVEATRRSA